MKARIKFTKTGVLRFIGHLDVMRYFQKAFKRADIGICYSSGYSPHQIISFAAPLGVGLTSEGEYVDIECRDFSSSKEIKDKLNAVMSEGISVVSVKKLEEDSKNAMSIVAAADYRIFFRDGYEKPIDMAEMINRFYDQEKILVMKKTKKSEKETDIKPLIYEIKPEKDSVFMKLATGSAENLKPELVMKAVYDFSGLVWDKFAIRVHRIEVYAVREWNGKLKFVTLEDLGEEIEK